MVDEAIQYYKSALIIYDEFGIINGRANILVNMGNTFLHKCEYEKSIFHYNEAEYLFNETGDIFNLSHIYLNLAIAYKEIRVEEKTKYFATKALRYFDILNDKVRAEKVKRLL